MGVVHLSHPLCSLRVLLHCLEEVDELLACCPREHGHGLPRKTRGGNFLDEVQQHPVLDPLPEQVGLDESRGVEGGAEDVDAVVIMPLAVVVRVRVVPKVAYVRDAMHLEGEKRVSGGGL